MCPGFPVVQGSTYTGSGQHYEDEIHYSCNPGLRTETGHAEETVICNWYGEWEPANVTCESKFRYYQSSKQTY